MSVPTPPAPTGVKVTVRFDIDSDPEYLRLVLALLVPLTRPEYWEDVGGASVTETISQFSETLYDVTPK